MSALIDSLREKRTALLDAMTAVEELTKTEDRSLTEDESAKFDADLAEVRKLSERIEELTESELRDARSAAALAQTAMPTAVVTNEPNPIYRKGDGSTSFFADLLARKNGDADAIDRLTRSQASDREARTGDLSTGSGVGGEFAPPLWIVDDFIKLARPSRPFADCLHSSPVPPGVSSVNLPKVSTGAAVANQAVGTSNQNTAVQDTALTTGAVNTGWTTIAGKQTVSQQMIDQSGIPFDEVILGDLTADYAAKLDAFALSAVTGTSGITSVADSAGSGDSGALEGKDVLSDVANAVSQIATQRYLPPDAIFMSPARWYWLVSQVDGNGRPLVVPNGPAYNQMASTGAPQAEGAVGTMLGLPVYLDSQIPSSGTSPAPADAIIVLRRDDHWLFESPLKAASFDATYADQLTLLFRVHAYAGFISRYPKSIAQVGGAAYSTAPSF